jgi:hypothetical protein
MNALVTVGIFLLLLARELWWVLRGTALLAWRHPLVTALLFALYGFLGVLDGGTWVLGIGVAAVALVLWCRFFPQSFARLISNPLWHRGRSRWLKKYWHSTATSCGLGMTKKTTRGFVERHEVTVDVVPRMKVLGWEGNQLRFRVRPLVGQTVEDVIDAGERLRHALDADRIEVRPEGRFAVVTASFGNALSTVFAASGDRLE